MYDSSQNFLKVSRIIYNLHESVYMIVEHNIYSTFNYDPINIERI